MGFLESLVVRLDCHVLIIETRVSIPQNLMLDL